MRIPEEGNSDRRSPWGHGAVAQLHDAQVDYVVGEVAAVREALGAEVVVGHEVGQEAFRERGRFVLRIAVLEHVRELVDDELGPGTARRSTTWTRRSTWEIRSPMPRSRSWTRRAKAGAKSSTADELAWVKLSGLRIEQRLLLVAPTDLRLVLGASPARAGLPLP